MKAVSEVGEKYNGFNILVADLCTGKMAYVSNRPKKNPIQTQNVLPGFHVLCNASLNTPWPKVHFLFTFMDKNMQVSITFWLFIRIPVRLKPLLEYPSENVWPFW